ncbi:MAG TPA: DUF5677 domain-containing protein [Vicinamibacterales bacterium]|nr:DUF5677 domain-containing protein [Vicinamibacterales bacterium]
MAGHPLHDGLLRLADTMTDRWVTEFVRRKFAAEGFPLTSSQTKRLRARIKAGNIDSLVFRRTKQHGDGVIRIQMTAADLEEINRFGEALARSVEVAVPAAISAVSGRARRTLVKGWAQEAARQSRAASLFEQRLLAQWGTALETLELLLTVCRELGDLTCQRVTTGGRSNRRAALVDVLSRLHARACQITAEVVSLLRHGFADGAMARWRTLHEVSVIALFIREHGNRAAEAYRDHFAIESARALGVYDRFQLRADLKPFSQRQRARIIRARDKVAARYPRAFQNEHGWAVPFLPSPNENPKFFHLEEAVGRDHLRPYYKLASQNVHAGPNGTFLRLGLPHAEDLLLAGPSNFGLGDAGQSAAISLTLVTTTFVTLSPTVDLVVGAKVAERLSASACDQFIKAHRAVTRNVNKLARARRGKGR